jgi:hypothetical protein
LYCPESSSSTRERRLRAPTEGGEEGDMVTVVELLMMPEVDTVGQELAEEEAQKETLPVLQLQ